MKSAWMLGHLLENAKVYWSDWKLDLLMAPQLVVLKAGMLGHSKGHLMEQELVHSKELKSDQGTYNSLLQFQAHQCSQGRLRPLSVVGYRTNTNENEIHSSLVRHRWH